MEKESKVLRATMKTRGREKDEKAGLRERERGRIKRNRRIMVKTPQKKTRRQGKDRWLRLPTVASPNPYHCLARTRLKEQKREDGK